MRYYGNDNETFVVTNDGRVWLVQSPDTDRVEELSRLPDDAWEVSEHLCQDLDLSDVPGAEEEVES